MAQIIWDGSTSGDWSDTTNWVSGAIPAANDDVVFPPDALITNAPTTNLDRTGDTAGAGLDLDTLTVNRGASYDIGTSSTPLQCTVDETVQILGSGKVFFKTDTGSGGHTSGQFVVDSPNQQAALILTGDTSIVRLDVLSGFVELATTDGTLGALNMLRSDRDLPPKVTISSGAVAIRRIFAGNMTSSHGSVTGDETDLYAGTLTQLTTMNGISPDQPVIRVYSGIFDYRGGFPVVGTALIIDAFGGDILLDTPNSTSGQVVVDTLNIYPRAAIKEGATATITNRNVFGESFC